MLLFSILTEKSILWLPVCLAAGAVYSWLLYGADSTFKETSKLARRSMMTLRFVLVSAICYLLLSPYLQTLNNKVEKPVIVIAQDNSESIVINTDSAFYRGEYPSKIANLAKQLEKKFTVKVVSFGEKTRDSLPWNYADKATDFSTMFQNVASAQSSRNLGAIIVASDGVYNKGAAPAFAAEASKIKCPVYTIALGDTIPPKDLSISGVKYNHIAFEGNTMPLEIQVNAGYLAGKSTMITVSEAGTKIMSKQVQITKEQFFSVINVNLPATKAGIHHYRIDATHLGDELSYRNNEKDLVIEVLKSRQKILIVSNAPNPDIGALRRSLETNLNFTVEVAMTDKFSGNVSDFNLVIMYQLPCFKNAATSIIQKLLTDKVPAFFICGSQTDLTKLNTLFPGIAGKSQKTSVDEALPVLNPAFPLFELDQEEKTFIEQCPPLFVPFSNYEMNNVNTLLYQKINTVETKHPLLFFAVNEDQKMAVMAGEGMWRWRMNCNRKTGDSRSFDVLVNKIANYLAIKDKRTKFKVTNDKVFNENQPVTFDAELYNDSYELYNEPEVKLTITNKDGKGYPFTFSKSGRAYSLDAGVFPVGDYSFAAKVDRAGDTLSFSGNFTVLPVNIEGENPVANHQALFNLSANNNGAMFMPRGIDSLYATIDANDDISAISHPEKTLKELVQIPLIFFLLLLLVSAEWFLRKYHGGY